MIAPLTGVRAFAALWVVAFHLRIGPGRAIALPGWIDWLCQLGYLGVDLFGLLSGFVIAHNYAERLAHRDVATAGRYLWIRAVRIMPLHWFALAVLVVAHAAQSDFDAPLGAHYRTSDLVKQVLLVHGFGFAQLAWNQPSWTVSSEWFCYLLFPLIAPWLASLRDGRRAALLAAATLVATAVAMRALGYPGFNTTADFGVFRIAGEFATGCLLQRAWASGFARSSPWSVIAPLAFAGAALAGAVAGAPGIVGCFAVLVYALAQNQGAFARLLATRPLLFLGEASYAIYIVHYVVLRLFANWNPVPGIAGAALVGRVALQLATILAVASAVHLAIENPTRRRLRGWVAPV